MVHVVMYADEKAPKSYYAVIFAGQKNDYSSLLVAPVIEGEEDYWNIVPKKGNRFNDLHEAYNFRDFLSASPMERIKMMKERGVTLFPSLSDESKKALLYIDDEPKDSVGIFKK